MDVLKLKRKGLRTSFTACVKKTEEELFKETLDSKQLSICRTQLKDKFDRLEHCQEEITDAILQAKDSETLFVEDFNSAEVYRDKFSELNSQIDIKLSNSALPTEISEKRNFKLPKIELRKFNGDAKDFLQFWSQFKKIHEDNGIPNEDKFQYLLQAVVPDSKAARVVESFPATAANYPKAIEQLRERFGREDLLVQIYVRDLLSMVMKNAISGRVKIDLPVLYDELEGKLRALESLGRTQEKYGEFLTPLVESCLPEEILIAWERSRNVNDLSSTKDARSLEHLMSFLRQEVKGEEMVVLARSGFGANPHQRKKEHIMEKKMETPTAASLVSVANENSDMNNRYPHAPDMNPPPGIPKGYPYGPTPMPTYNPVYPTGIGFMPNTSASPYPPTSPFSAASGNPYSAPSNSSYPATSSPYSLTSNSPYPASTSPYPLSSNSPYAASTSPYPASSNSAYPASTSPYAASSNRPYPASTSSYPSSGNNLYPATTSMYPATSNNPYPATASSSHLPGMSPYPSMRPGLNNKFGASVPYQTSSFPGHHQNMAHFMVSEGTVQPYPDFDPKQDAEILRKAMKGFGTDEKAIINVLAKRSNAQRIYIAVAFKQLYGKDLIDDLKSELSGNFENVIVGLMTPLNDYLASEVHNAISGVGTDEDVLVEVLCTRTNQEIWGINESYQRLYGKNMESDIKSDTSGHFERLLVSTCTGARSEALPDEERAKQNAHALFAAGVGQWGTDESVFNSILVAESFHQLAVTFYEYEKLAGHTVADAIDREMSGDLKKGMLAIARSVENRPLYFAEKLYKAMKGLGTDDRTLIRIIVTRCEIDMMQIKAEYERKYGKPLADAIHGDTSGDYRRVLIALVDGY